MKNFKAGTFIKQDNYKSFQPEHINRPWQIDDMELLNLLSLADRHMGRLDMYSEYIPNIDLFISMHVLKEATQSNKIEGSKTNIEDALLEKEDVFEEKRDDWEEVQNYISALNGAISKLEQFPFSSRLIRETHGILLSGVRGKHKLPGEFRSSQNWIGGSSISNATFIPPIHQSIGDYMADFERFAHSDTMPDLLKVALIHYQFETIHPFLDGNGRVGRLLITLYLVEKNILKKPILYLSDFFERKRIDYYDNLMRVRLKNDLNTWFRFFLTGIIETAKNSISTFDNIMKMQKDLEVRIERLGTKANNINILLRHLYQTPVIYAYRVQEITGLSMPTVYSLLDTMENMNILREITGRKRRRIYSFAQYINLFR